MLFKKYCGSWLWQCRHGLLCGCLSIIGGAWAHHKDHVVPSLFLDRVLVVDVGSAAEVRSVHPDNSAGIVKLDGPCVMCGCYDNVHL